MVGWASLRGCICPYEDGVRHLPNFPCPVHGMSSDVPWHHWKLTEYDKSLLSSMNITTEERP